VEVSAVTGWSFAVSKGEFIAVLGHNGSGKSTLAKLINALLIPDAGRMRVFGLDTSAEDNVWQIRQKASMVFQNPDNQIIATIVEEDVAFGPENLGLPSKEIRERVDWALETVGMADYAEHSPHFLSGGQKQRVSIAGVLAMKSDIIILDEPTAMLDPIGRREVLDAVSRLNKEEGMTVILITHYMEEAALADRVIVMDHGGLVMDAPPREAFSQAGLLRTYGLNVPQVTEIGHRLREAGFDVPEGVLGVDELAECVLRLDGVVK
jgi:energy-coupling factor transport system ATP-binding protein